MQLKIETVLPFVLVWLSLVNYCESARILSVIPFPMKSHDIVYKPLLIELARRGHKVTSITCYPSDKVLHENYNEIVFETKAKDLIKNSDFYEIRRNTNIWNVGWTDLIEFWDLNNMVTENIFSTPAVEKLINSKDIKYDLVICEGFFSYESLFAFGELYEAPVITVASFGSSIYLNPNIGNPIESAYYPMFLLPYTDEMSLIQRTHNFVFNMYVLIASNLIHIPNQEKIMKKYFTDAIKPRKIRPLKDLLANVSIAFVNSHVALGYPRPNLPNVIDVGGLHIQPLTNDTIDQDLQKLLDSATNGVIYFSLGSNVNIAKMPNNYKQAFLDAFSKLPQIVLWKSDDVSSFGDTGSFPKNVKVRKWFQQQQVLGHKNCVAFITHGGLLSLEEALFNAIPIIGIPFFGDQFMNMKLVEKYYFGIELDYNNITYESVASALNQVINNKMYKENAKRFSSIFKGDYQSPLERAVYWVEYVLKYDGASHLKSRRRLLPISQLLLIDVLLFLTAIVFIFFKIINIILIRPIRCLTGRKCRKENSQERISNETKKTK